ncbi:hypothetical protein QCA50_004782 [Cerrena zonata]|uniref:U3 small nucleolar RNA-associated protein 20 n=1 Tax=Cerrena zonata TaxID=2478898 RepID=A0AAW0GMG1_9APHY
MEDERPAKRFKYQSYQRTLKDVHLPSALSKNQYGVELAEVSDNSSHFYESLNHWKELNLTNAFAQFARQVEPLSASMPLLLHNWQDVVRTWMATVENADDEGLKPLLDLLQKLIHDLRTTLAPLHTDILKQTLRLLPRSLSAQTHTMLLETFSALFKYLLIPLETTDEAWSAFLDVVPKCNPEVQRAVAELWGSILRRLKSGAREEITLAIIASANPDVSAWVFVSACKSVSQTLHTTTSTIFLPMLQYYLECEDPELSFTVLRRTLTALAHHCKTAEQYSPLADILTDEAVTIDPSQTERLRRLLEITSVPASVRQGSRLTAKALSSLLSQFQKFPLSEDILHAAILKFTASCLTAGDMGLWMGPGRKVFEKIFECPTLGLELCGVLSDLNWGGWKSLALPRIMKLLPTYLDNHSDKSLELLVALVKGHRLDGIDVVWKQRVQTWVDGRFSDWNRTDVQMFEFAQILETQHMLPSLSPLLIRVIESTLNTPAARSEFDQRETNSAWLLGASLSCLSKRKAKEWSDLVDIQTWTRSVIQHWGWSGYTMSGLVDLIRVHPAHESTLSGEELYDSLQNSLLSHSRLLRLSVLHVLSSVTLPTDSAEVVKRCLQGEEVSLDVQGARERVLRITRLGQSLQDSDSLAVDIAIRWLTAQLKVNLRPLWSPTAQALSTIAEHFGDSVWEMVFNELRGISESPDSEVVPHWMHDQDNEELDPISEVERTWRDPSGHKFRSQITLWLRGDAARRIIIRPQIIQERFDPNTYESQLLATLGECSSLAEKHSRDLVPLFLSMAPPDTPTKMPRYKLSAWLELFSKFTNPKALRSTEELHRLYIVLLSHPDRPLQKLVLSCLLTYKSSHLLPHADTLRMLLDETRWRDELTQLQVAEIEESDRPELVDILIKMLFGIMLEKKGRSRGADRRAAILTALAGCTDLELTSLVDLMLRPINKDRQPQPQGSYTVQALPSEVTDKQLVGFLNLLGDVVKQLGSRLLSVWPSLLSTLLDTIAYAQGRISQSSEIVIADEEGEENEDDTEEKEEGTSNASRTIRTVRQLGLKRFADFFRVPVTFDFRPYLAEAYRTFISPRLPTLDIENTQSPSSLLELFYIWSRQPDTVHLLVDFDNHTLSKIYDCLVATNVKPAVVVKVFDIVDNILRLSLEDSDILEVVLKPHVPVLLSNISTLVERTKAIASMTDTIGRRQISILSELAPFISDSEQASALLTLFIPLLRKPSKVLPEKIKADMLNIIRNFLPFVTSLSDLTSPVYSKTHSLLALLFQQLRSRPARIGLVATFHVFASIQPALQPLAQLLEDLNAFSTRRMEEPDFDRRLGAFTRLNETFHATFSTSDWLPILYNMLNFIQDADELTIRNNASFTMKRFIDRVSTDGSEFEATFTKVLYPGLKNGLRSKNELVRGEILGVIAYAITKCENIATLQEMRGLLAGGDEEASFFNNIHHIQVHRRTRALRRLADYCDEGHIRSVTLAEIFVPLVGNFIVSAVSIDHQIVTQAILTTGRMARQLKWGAYYTLIQQYLRLAKAKDASERVYVRAIVCILENFHFSMTDIEEVKVVTADKETEDNEDEDEQALDTAAREQARIADLVNSRLLPTLLRHLEDRDETEESLRIPVAIGIVQVALHLPSSTGKPQVTRLLTVLSQILRSKSQDTRDLTRDTLCKIAVLLGPEYLPTMLQELRGALLRGPHLHILAFVTHAILVHVTTEENVKSFHTLDDCVHDAAHVSAEVIFGESGKDVLSEEFKTKMREVRSSSSKGVDSFAIIAKFITPSKISSLLIPVRNILHETETLRVMQQVEELLRRISGGLNSNEHLKPKDLISLCNTLISENSRFVQAPAPAPSKSKKRRGKADSAIVQMKRTQGVSSDHYANNSFRFVVFGLELFNTALRRGRFDFQDSSVMTRLESMVSTIGNTLYSNHMHVVIPGLKAAAGLIKCPLKTIEKSLPVFIRQMIDIVKQAGSTESEAVQTAFKSLSAILRDHPGAQVKEKDLVFLIEVLSPDLEEPARQASVFAMLRAIVSRKFVVPEIYDIMEKVSEIMVTNQSTQVQELCRGVLLQFLLDYPQGKGRLKNQMTFLAKNLSYVHESGRKSVMELLSAILAKFNPSLIKEYSDLLFVALVMVIANDDSAKCREMASALIKTLFGRLEEQQRRVVLSHVHSWASQRGQAQLLRVSSQVYSIIIDHLQQDITSHAILILEDLSAILVHSTQTLDSLTDDDDQDEMDVDLDWQISYHALVALNKLLAACPDFTTDKTKLDWTPIIAHLLFPHAWVRTASCRLVAVLFSAVPIAAPKEDLPEEDPFGLMGMEEVAKKLCLQLKSENLDATLGLLIVKNLFYVGKCFAARPLPSTSSEEPAKDGKDNDDGEDDDQSENEDEESAQKERHPLPWLFSKLSYQARSAHISRRNTSSSPENWYHQPASVFRWFAAMVNHMEPTQVERFSPHIISPVYRIAEDDTIRDPHMDELKTLAIELQDLLQTKVGTSKFSNVYNGIRQNVISVRRDRRTARAVQAVTNPEVSAKKRMQKNVLKKESRKRKGQSFQEYKGKSKKRRED